MLATDADIGGREAGFEPMCAQARASSLVPLRASARVLIIRAGAELLAVLPDSRYTAAVPRTEQVVLDNEVIDRTVRRMAASLLELTAGAEQLALVGIRRGGVPLARLLAAQIEHLEGRRVPVGTVDITLYRDDAATALPNPRIGPSEVPFDVNGRDVVLVDDVLQTGRTIRAALDCLLDYGRPRRVWLAVLCDRGGRELPIAADVVGRTVSLGPDQRLDVVLDDERPRAMVSQPPPPRRDEP